MGVQFSVFPVYFGSSVCFVRFSACLDAPFISILRFVLFVFIVILFFRLPSYFGFPFSSLSDFPSFPISDFRFGSRSSLLSRV